MPGNEIYDKYISQSNEKIIILQSIVGEYVMYQIVVYVYSGVKKCRSDSKICRWYNLLKSA